MRRLFPSAAVFSAALLLTFYCSCERHQPSELPEEGEHGRAQAIGGEKAGAAVETHQKVGEDPGVLPPTPTPTPTPAEFFPNSSPR